MPWPTLDQYQTAVQHPELFLRHESLKKAQVEKRAYGIIQLPFARSGNFGAVYKFCKFCDNDRSWAVKVFIREDRERHERYRCISDTTDLRCLSPFLNFEYQDQGIQIGENWFPVLVMDWAEGNTLNEYLQQRLSHAAKVDNDMLCREWIALVLDMQRIGVAHGDLQHGNILVGPNGKFKLVDYDGMYVPSMQGKKSIELGLPPYQHPRRDRDCFNPSLDDFAAMVILLQLLTVNKMMWQRFHLNEDHLLIAREDLIAPDRSPYIQGLVQLPSRKPYSAIKRLAEMVLIACKNSPTDIPSFIEVLREIEMDRERCPVPESNGPDFIEEELPLPPSAPISDSPKPAVQILGKTQKLVPAQKQRVTQKLRISAQIAVGEPAKTLPSGDPEKSPQPVPPPRSKSISRSKMIAGAACALLLISVLLYHVTSDSEKRRAKRRYSEATLSEKTSPAPATLPDTSTENPHGPAPDHKHSGTENSRPPLPQNRSEEMPRTVTEISKPTNTGAGTKESRSGTKDSTPSPFPESQRIAVEAKAAETADGFVNDIARWNDYLQDHREVDAFFENSFDGLLRKELDGERESAVRERLARFSQENKRDPGHLAMCHYVGQWFSPAIVPSAVPRQITIKRLILKNGKQFEGNLVETTAGEYKFQYTTPSQGQATFKITKKAVKKIEDATIANPELTEAKSLFVEYISALAQGDYAAARHKSARIPEFLKRDVYTQRETAWATAPELLMRFPPPLPESADEFLLSQLCPECQGSREVPCHRCPQQKWTPCSFCDGTGVVVREEVSRCSSCGGRGYFETVGRRLVSGGNRKILRSNCATCHGKGKITRQKRTQCTECNGSKGSMPRCHYCNNKRVISCRSCNGTGKRARKK